MVAAAEATLAPKTRVVGRPSVAGGALQVSSVVSVLLCVAAAPGRVGYGVSAFPKAFLLLINTKISSRNNYFKINSTD